jgi:hypothetical protein
MGSPNGGIIGVINPTSFGKVLLHLKHHLEILHYNQVQELFKHL